MVITSYSQQTNMYLQERLIRKLEIAHLAMKVVEGFSWLATRWRWRSAVAAAGRPPGSGYGGARARARSPARLMRRGGAHSKEGRGSGLWPRGKIEGSRGEPLFVRLQGRRRHCAWTRWHAGPAGQWQWRGHKVLGLLLLMGCCLLGFGPREGKGFWRIRFWNIPNNFWVLKYSFELDFEIKFNKI